MVRKTIGKDKTHLKLTLRVGGTYIDAIGFGMAGKEFGKNVDIAFSLEVNEWQGKRDPQLVLRDITDAEVAAVEGISSRSCRGCRALLTRSGFASECDLGFTVDPARDVPLKPCPRPMTYLALKDAQEG